MVNSLTIHPIRPTPIDGITEDKQWAQNDTKSQQLSRNIDEWLISIDKYNEGTTKKHRVERVPSILRGIESNEKCFYPLIVSIGPYYHKESKLQAFQTLKFECAKQFHFCGDQVSIRKLIAEVENARECYEEGSTKDFDNESFFKMMFLDGCFVLHFMCTLQSKTSYNCFVYRDLFLLDNQIPLPILRVLMECLGLKTKEKEIIHLFLINKLHIMLPPETSWLNKIKKFFKKDSDTNGDNKKDQDKLNLDGREHLLDLMREHLIGPRRDSHRAEGQSYHWYPYRSVTELRSAGIHFRASKTHHVTDVDFKSHLICGGTLKLPPIVVDDSTEPLLLNLVDYEMRLNDPEDLYISSYIVLMDSLIDHADDVKELRKRGILLNCLGSDEQLAKLFNKIADGVVDNPNAYANIKCRIAKQCENQIQVWIAEWMHNHFSSPWTLLAFLGALLALGLSILQTILAIYSRG